MYKRVGWYVMRVLAGAAPGTLPIEQPTTFELVINKKTAQRAWPCAAAKPACPGQRNGRMKRRGVLAA
jgi:hypothetical protein